MKWAYYNDDDANVCEWVRRLIAKGMLPDGEVDCRSIGVVQPGDLAGFAQVHLFCGIGGWAYACRFAGWPDDRPIWTGSCPCQPFSVAGRRGGTDDPRHLWPDFLRLIRAVRPPVIMGEQVAGAAGYGWFNGVQADLAGEGYASRGVDIPACAVDAPHIRSRLYWCAMADTAAQGDGREIVCGPGEGGSADYVGASGQLAGSHGCGNVADANGIGGNGRPTTGGQQTRTNAGADSSNDRNVGHACITGLEGNALPPGNPAAQRKAAKRADGRNGTFWSDAEWLACHDGKTRRAQPGTSMLVDGLPGRVALWRGFGNAIVAPLAAQVIGAFMDCDP